jgi:prepilin-type N-terminal cleavage/methylation domain-containing protein
MVNNYINNYKTRAFTIIELMVVVSIIAVLAALLIVAVSGSMEAAKTAKANVKLKEIGSWMQLWSGENKNRVLPSQFDFNDEADSGSTIRVRRDEHAADDNPNDNITRLKYQGTWADILWTDNELYKTHGLRDREEGEAHLRWQSDSPDNDIYQLYDSFDHPFRSTIMNTRGPEKGLPGFFAANDFFDSRSDNDADGDTNSEIDRYYTYAMINAPSSSVYLVDSVGGETIGSDIDSWDVSLTSGDGPISQDDEPLSNVDFRHGDECMMLILDGSIARVAPWSERGPLSSPPSGADLSLYGKGYRVHDLVKRKPSTN